MPTVTLRRAARLAVAVAVCAAASAAHGQVYKCTDAAGKTTYSGTPCDVQGKPLELPNDPTASTTDPNMCGQLLDETRRLAAEAGADAKRGRKESADRAKRRQALTRQYEARCVGISRSGGKPKQGPGARPGFATRSRFRRTALGASHPGNLDSGTRSDRPRWGRR